MAPYSSSVLNSNIKAMRRSIRASMAPVPSPTGHKVLKSLRRHVQKLKSNVSFGLSYLASALASTAGDLACCARPAVTGKWEYASEELEARQLEIDAAYDQERAYPVEPQPPQPPMPLVPGSSNAQQPAANPSEEPIDWDALVVATADFAALPSAKGTCQLLEDETSSLFGNDVEPAKQRQEKRQALEMRAAAQATQPRMSAEEVLALRAAAKARREAAAAERAAELQRIDAKLQAMEEDSDRLQWFKEHAGPTEADTKVKPEDKWDDPEIQALVEGLKQLKGLEACQ